MRHKETEDAKSTTRRLFIKHMNPFSRDRITLFDVVAKGDTDKEKKLVLLLQRIVHILCLVTVPSAIIGLIFILSSRNFVPNTSSEVIIVTVILYLISIIMVFIGYKCLNISRLFAKYLNKLLLIELVSPPEYYDYFRVLSTHMFRILMFFEIAILFGFLLGMIGDNIYPAIPLFIMATVALILTYPTNRRLEEWLNTQEDAEKVGH